MSDCPREGMRDLLPDLVNGTLAPGVRASVEQHVAGCDECASELPPAVYDDMLHLRGASIYEGNSGGPVLDGAGQVVGIMTLASPSQPAAYAIPISRVLPTLTAWAHSG